MTSWNSQSGESMYSIQFETDDRELYKIVEKACKEAIDRSAKKRLMEFDDGTTAYKVCYKEGCRFTTDIEHAKNFIQPVKGIFEEKTRS